VAPGLEGSDALPDDGPVPYGLAVDGDRPKLPPPDDQVRPITPPIGKVSQFLGNRLLMIWAITGVIGLALLSYAGFKVWQVVSRGTLGADIVPLVAFGGLAFALLSISGSARRTGLKYLRGERAVSRDLLRYVVRRMERRRQARGR
jgi:hypothetical protein